MTLLTVVIPYVKAHEKVMERALKSVRSQTVPVNVITVEDKHREGPAKARNEGVRQATTPLVTFLDADDILLPEYAEQAVRYWRPGFYVYTDFMKHGAIQRTADCIDFRNARRHIVTCVISKEDFWRVGGFDETLEKAEDVEFWYKCHWYGVIGLRCPVPLVDYTSDYTIRRYDRQFRAHHIVNWLNNVKYGRLHHMGCCGDDEWIVEMRVCNQPVEGYVLVACGWAGNRKVNGRATGIMYGRCGNGNLIWIDPRDQQAEPDRFVLQPESIDDEETVQVEPVGSPLDSFSKEELVEYAQSLGIEVDLRYGVNTIRELIDEVLAR